MKKWAAEFKRGRESVEVDGRSGCHKDATTDENIKVMHTVVMCDRRRDLRFIASEVGISIGAVQSILTDTRVENAEQTMEAPWLKKFKRVHSAGKVIASILWVSQGVIMIDYFEQGHLINGAYDADELRRLSREITIKKR